MISETCSCGASFQVDRSDELKLVNQWRQDHKCRPQEGNLAIIDSARIESAPLGFMATGLVDPARSPYPEWDDE